MKSKRNFYVKCYSYKRSMNIIFNYFANASFFREKKTRNNLMLEASVKMYLFC